MSEWSKYVREVPWLHESLLSHFDNMNICKKCLSFVFIKFVDGLIYNGTIFPMSGVNGKLYIKLSGFCKGMGIFVSKKSVWQIIN